jgi:hypothetical protein
MRLHGLVTELAKDAYELAPPKLHRKSRHVELRWKLSLLLFIEAVSFRPTPPLLRRQCEHQDDQDYENEACDKRKHRVERMSMEIAIAGPFEVHESLHGKPPRRPPSGPVSEPLAYSSLLLIRHLLPRFCSDIRRSSSEHSHPAASVSRPNEGHIL